MKEAMARARMLREVYEADARRLAAELKFEAWLDAISKVAVLDHVLLDGRSNAMERIPFDLDALHRARLSRFGLGKAVAA